MNSTKRRLELPALALPWHQQLVMRLYLGPVVASASNTAHNRVVYEKFSGKIIELASAVPFQQHGIPVLVPAQAGLLDDTRYWSIAQTLEHLLLLDNLAKQIILKLARGEPADILITPAMVVAKGRCGAEKVFEDYKASVPKFLPEIESALRDSNSELTEVHPIFGPFTARQWQWSLGVRTSLRYRQLLNIQKGLSFDPAAGRRLSLLPAIPGA